jgi:hypothetical protein
LDLSATVPGTALGRYTELQLNAVVNGSGGCADRPPVRITLDPASTVTATPAQPPYTGGFADLPAALRPVYQVATDGRRLADLNRVLQVALALQRQVRSTLDPQLVEPSTLLASSAPGILVTTASVPDGLDLPLQLGDDELRLPDGRFLQADADLAVAEVSATANRLLLVIGGTRTDLTAGLLDWLGDPAQFGSLRGDVAVWDGGTDPITLAIRSGSPPVAPPVVTPWWQTRAVRLIAIAVLAAAVLGVIVGRVMVRRRRPGGAMAVSPETSGPSVGPSGDGQSRDR